MNATTDYWTATAAAVVAAATTRPPITIHYDDGSMYQGDVNEHGKKHGQGTLKTEIYITGVVGDENSHLMKWTEFSGNWFNDVMHGTGVMRKMSGNGDVKVVYDGMWDTGVPINPAPDQVDEIICMDIMSDDGDDGYDGYEEEEEEEEEERRRAMFADDDEYYRRYNESPRRGDYDHREEAS